MSYTELKLNDKTYKFELTFQGMKNIENDLGESILILLTDSKKQLDVLSAILIEALKKHHADEVKDKEAFLNEISSKDFTRLANFIGKQFETDDVEGKGKVKV